MDTSEQYIKMRLAAIPYLKMGDSSFALTSPYFVTEQVWIAPNGNYYCSQNVGGETDITIGCQLERQDQLQEMVDIRGLQSLTWAIHQFSESQYGSSFTISGTMEQLWLAFVMKEKYGKVWTGEDWERK